jgi:hypothetical protein
VAVAPVPVPPVPLSPVPFSGDFSGAEQAAKNSAIPMPESERRALFMVIGIPGTIPLDLPSQNRRARRAFLFLQ